MTTTDTITVRLSAAAIALLIAANFGAYDSIHDDAAAHFGTIDRDDLKAKTDLELDLNQRWAIAQYTDAFQADKDLPKGSRTAARSVLGRVDPDGDLRNCEPPSAASPSSDGPAGTESNDLDAAAAAAAGTDPVAAAAAATATASKKKRTATPATVPVKSRKSGPFAVLRDDAEYHPSLTTLARFQACLNGCTALIKNEEGEWVKAPKDADPAEVMWILVPAKLISTMDKLAAKEEALGNPVSPVTAWYTRAGSHWRTGIGFKTAKACGFECSVRVRKKVATVMFKPLDAAPVAAQSPAEAANATEAAPEAPATVEVDAAAATPKAGTVGNKGKGKGQAKKKKAKAA